MTPAFHSTRDFHLNDLQTLGWELTVCNSLWPEKSPCRGVLRRGGSYGRLLYGFLDRIRPMKDVGRVLEVGGGYGFLMRDFLDLDPGLIPTMLDLSPVLLERQREILTGARAGFVHADFLDVDPSFLEGFDLAVFNENLGDFPVVTGIDRKALRSTGPEGPGPLLKAVGFFSRYDLDFPESDPFNCNIGAMMAVEKLCRAGVPRIFLSEHSCEATVPERLAPFVRIVPTGNPERISLRGHDEYTIAFSHLEKIARRFGYESLRGPLADFIEIDWTDRLRSILRSRLSMNDEHEIIRQFVEDLYKYEFVFFLK